MLLDTIHIARPALNGLVSNILYQWGHRQNGQRNYVTLFLSLITLGRIATIHKARAGFSCASGKRYMIGSPNILDKAIIL